MKVAIHNAFFGEEVAESELARRICLALTHLGWMGLEVATSKEIEAFAPDFVMALHFKTPKLTGYPTYGCMWNPPAFFQSYERKMNYAGIEKHVLSYDGFLSSSPMMDRWLKEKLQETSKPSFILPFYTSCNETEYVSVDLTTPKLAYIGSNWDIRRFESLFIALDRQPYMRVYGRRIGWKFLQCSYQGSIPFDGWSLLHTLRSAGVGLCLHLDEHTATQIPSMRIFEIVAAGAIAICGDHPFIRSAFGDTVLYIDPKAAISQVLAEISQHMNWIAAHPHTAQDMAKAAHEIFRQQFTLEHLFCKLAPWHDRQAIANGWVTDVRAKPDWGRVEVIVRVGGRPVEVVKRALDSLANQTYRNIGVIVVCYQFVIGLEELLRTFSEQLVIKQINSSPTGFRSTQLFDGLCAVQSEYFAILDDDDMLHRNHIFLLLQLLHSRTEYGVAYSGSIRIWENNSKDETAHLAYFDDFNMRRLIGMDNSITSNSFVARTILLATIATTDPQLVVAEDFYLILELAKRARFIFSYQVSCAHVWTGTENTSIAREKPALVPAYFQLWNDHTDRLLARFWNEDFPVAWEGGVPIKLQKFSVLRHQPIVTLGWRGGLPLPIYNGLRKFYLNLTDGGHSNPSPSWFSQILIRLKSLLFS